LSPVRPLSPHHEPLNVWDRRALALLAIGIVIFGAIVEIRGCFLRRHQTDVGVFLRAAWAVRVGGDIYDITDENGWHYHYPPLFAILMTPLADPPPGVERWSYLPLPFSVGLCYLASLACLVFAVHSLASLFEQTSSNPHVRSVTSASRRWWRLRLIPVFVFLIPTGQTLARGQVSLLLLALLAGFAADLYRRRNHRAGLWLAAAICLKIIPAFLLVIPLWQRNFRCLAGCVLGLLLGLLVIPAAVFGPTRTLEYYIEYDAKLLRPGVGDTTDRTRATELTAVTATDSQSLLAIIHNTIYPDRFFRPREASAGVRIAHWLLGCLLTVITLAAVGSATGRGAVPTVLFVFAIVFNMLLLSPVSHLHYFCLLIPLAMALLANAWDTSAPTWRAAPWGLFAVVALAGLVPVVAEQYDRAFAALFGQEDYAEFSWELGIPPLVFFRDMGLATYGAAAMWIAACVELRRRATEQSPRPAKRTALAPVALAAR
jgi:hypothetical protein